VSDTPSNYSGFANYLLFVNQAANALEFRAAGFGLSAGATLSVDTSVIPALSSDNVFTGTNSFSGDVTISSTAAFDATAASRTAPHKVGTSLPANCAVGDTFFKSNAAAGSNLYLCTATNTWTQVSGGGSGGSATFLGLSDTPSSYSGQAGKFVRVNSAANALEFASVDWSDVANKPSTFNAGQLQGRNVASTAPSNGQVLAWNSSSNQWEPSTAAGVTTFTGLTDTPSSYSGAANNLVFVNQSASSLEFRPVGFGLAAGATLAVDTSVVPALNTPNSFSGTTTFQSDVTLTSTASLDATAAARTAPIKTGTTLPSNCAVGDIFFKTNATAGQNLFLCTATNTWTQLTAGSSSQPPRTVQISLGDGSNVIQAGLSRWVVVPHSGTIVACTILADTAGNITVYWLKKNAGLPTSSDSIGSCSLSGAQYVKNTTLSGWSTTTVSADDWLRVEVTGTPSGVKAATVALVIQP